MYYTHPSYRTFIVIKNCAYYIRIFTVDVINKYNNSNIFNVYNVTN